MDSNLQQEEYKVVTRAELATAGYIRIHASNNNDIPPWIRSLCFEYFGFFFVPPNKDPSNFITSSDIKTANTLREEGNKFVKEKKYTQAIKQYTKSLSLNINDGKTRSNRCLCYLKCNDLDKAFSDARQAIYNEPTWYKSWLRLAQVFEAKQWYSECLDMIMQAMMICDELGVPKKSKKILEKYYMSVSTKADEFFELYQEQKNIDHMNDEDRLEWKHCKPGIIKEDYINLEKLMDAPPWKIYFYREGITPERLAKAMSQNKCDYKTKSHEYDERYSESEDGEFDRWMERKWLKKIVLFGKINGYKLLLNADVIIENASVSKDEIWTVSWSAGNSLYLNKRYLSLNINTRFISNDDTKCIFMSGTYCKPTAEYIIQCIKVAIMTPLDAMFRMVNHMMGGGDVKDWKAERLPIRIDIQNRMKDEFDDVAFAMWKYGVRCNLMQFDDDLLRSCKKYNTDPHGWNYMDSKPYYRYDRDNDL